MSVVEFNNAVELSEYLLAAGGYRAVRVLPDGSIAAIGDLLYTRAVFLGCNREGWAQGFALTTLTWLKIGFHNSSLKKMFLKVLLLDVLVELNF